jgi:hypothetical protein
LARQLKVCVITPCSFRNGLVAGAWAQWAMVPLHWCEPERTSVPRIRLSRLNRRTAMHVGRPPICDGEAPLRPPFEENGSNLLQGPLCANAVMCQ